MPSTRPASALENAPRFVQLRRGPAAFVMPSPWEAGSALRLAGLGFDAWATSSAACAQRL